ncbi:MAG: four helix bundle protein [Sphingobacteriaceae bacterium]
MRKFQELTVWHKSHQLTLKVYQISCSFPKEEAYGLILQIRRSSASVPTNIAEGCGRNSNAEMKRFLIISAGSASELEYQFILARDLNYITETDYQELNQQVTEIRKMLFAFIQTLN